MSDQGNLVQTSGWAQFFYHLHRIKRPLNAHANAPVEIPAVLRIGEFFSKLGGGLSWMVLFIMTGLTSLDASNITAM